MAKQNPTVETVQTTTVDVDALLAEMAAIKAENAKLVANMGTVQATGVKVSTKGAVSVYGLGRFPVTLYAEQWGKLLGMGETITKFIADNKSKLSYKPAKV